MLQNLTLPSRLISIGDYAFLGCFNLTSLVMPKSVTWLGNGAFQGCRSLGSIYFAGDAPSLGTSVFGIAGWYSDPATVYYLPGSTGWGTNYGGLPTVLWNPQLQLTGGVVQVTGNTNIPVVVEACTNLASPVWTPLQNTTLTGGTLSITDAPPNAGSRFYRVRSP